MKRPAPVNFRIPSDSAFYLLLLASALLVCFFSLCVVPARAGIDWSYSADAGCGQDYAMAGNWSRITLPFSLMSPPRQACFIGGGGIPQKLELGVQDCISGVYLDGESVFQSGQCGSRCADCGGKTLDFGANGRKLMVVTSNFGSLLRFDALRPAPTGAIQLLVFALLLIFIVSSDEARLTKPATAVAVALVASTAFLLPVLEKPDYWGRGDWDSYMAQSAILGRVMAGYHQFPLWNPFQCGGNVLLGYPGTVFPAPLMAVEFVFGVVAGVKVNLILYLLIGFIGAVLLASYLRLGVRSRYLFGFVFAYSGFFSYMVYEGHLQHLSIVYVPYILVYLLKSFHRARYVLPCSLFTVLFVGMSHPSLTVVLAVLFIIVPVCESLARMATGRKKGLMYAIRPLVVLAAVAILSASLFGFRLLPELEFSVQNPRELLDYGSGFDWKLLYGALAGPSYSSAVPPGLGWPEYAGTIGLPALALSVLGLAVSTLLWRRYAAVWVFLGFAIVLSFGSNSPLDMWGALHRLPLFNSLQMPSRTISFITLFVALFSALGMSAIEKRSGNLAKVAFILSVSVMLSSTITPLAGAFNVMPYRDDLRQGAFQQVRLPGLSGAYSGMYAYSYQDVGLANCYMPGSLDRMALSRQDTSYRGETYLLNGKGAAAYAMLSPDSFEVDVNSTGDDVLVVNQNFESGWMLDGGGKVQRYHGLISANVTEGRRTLSFSYMPDSFIAGSAITLAGIVACALLLRRYGLSVFSPAPDDEPG